MPGGISYGLLGPLSIARGDEVLTVSRPQERAVLAILLLNANTIVSADELIDSLWGERPPSKPLNSLRATISNVRKILADPEDPQQAIVAELGGYRLGVNTELKDTHQFDLLLSRARGAFTAGDTNHAAPLVDDALKLVRGEPLSDMAYADFAQPEILRLGETILAARELRFQIALAAGECEIWLADISKLVQKYPVREGLRAIQMKALYQTGRQAEALTSYGEHRQRLVEDLGIDPAPELQRLEAQILSQELPLTTRQTGPEPFVQTVSTQLPGRLGERQTLDDLAQRGSGIGFVTGEAGSGKSALLDTYLSDLSAQGWAGGTGILSR